MRKAVLAFAVLLMIGMAVQFFLAGYGAYSAKPPGESFEAHITFGRMLGVATILLVVLAAIARLPGRLMGAVAGVLGLVVVQTLIVVVSEAIVESDDLSTNAGRLVFGLHALNGMAIIMMLREFVLKLRQLVMPSRTAGDSAQPVGSRS